MHKIREYLTSGGDERITLNEDGVNKYFIDPMAYQGVFNRGSCTCSPLNEETFQFARSFVDQYSPERHGDIVHSIRRELKEQINFKKQDKFDLFLAPSGSDLCYVPLLINTILHPQAPVNHLVTCPEELGQGSILALQGKYFSERSQFGTTLPKGERLPGVTPDITYLPFPARTEKGLIQDHRNPILRAIDNIPKDQAIVGHLVVGSKSGIVDNIEMVNHCRDRVMWVVDICQSRVSRKLIHDLLDKGCLIMITGSKFYQSPPFCGAMLIPKMWSERIRQQQELPDILSFGTLFSQYNVPDSWFEVRARFPEFHNPGLMLRWSCALYEFRQITRIRLRDILNTVHSWHQTVVEELQSHADVFELMPDTDRTNNSIISFRVKNGEGGYLSHEELQALYADISSPSQQAVDGYNKVLIGQPVRYGERSFIRVALGSYNIRQLILSGNDFGPDRQLMRFIAIMAKKRVHAVK